MNSKQIWLAMVASTAAAACGATHEEPSAGSTVATVTVLADGGAPVCGNGILEVGEECDMGGTARDAAGGNSWECIACNFAAKYIACAEAGDCDSATPTCAKPRKFVRPETVEQSEMLADRGACTTACTSDAQCPIVEGVGTGQARCFAGTCRPKCGFGRECPADTVCVQSACLP